MLISILPIFLLKKTVNNSRESIYDETDFVEGLNKSEFKNYCPKLLKTHILFLINFCTNK